MKLYVFSFALALCCLNTIMAVRAWLLDITNGGAFWISAVMLTTALVVGRIWRETKL